MELEVVPVFVHRAKQPKDRYKYDLDSVPRPPFTDGTNTAFYAYGSSVKVEKNRGPAGPEPTASSKVRDAYPTEKGAAIANGLTRELNPPGDVSAGPWAFVEDEEFESISVYAHKAGSGADERYKWTLAPGDAGKAWSAGTAEIYAYKEPRRGTVAIYGHSASSPDRMILDGRPEAHDGWGPGGAPLFYAIPTGYRVGDLAADINGYDESNNKKVSLRSVQDGASWIWISVCAAWCGPCNFMARKMSAFVDNVNNQGLKLKPFEILASGPTGGPSAQTSASVWATKYKLAQVLHCNGAADSELLDLIYRYARANGQTTIGYPTSVLVDPKGVIRDYQLGMDLQGLQESLARYSGTALTGPDWWS